MIIVSQDKKNIFNFENIEFIEIAENKTTIRCQCKIDLNCWLGNYKTEERAKEVLSEIAIAQSNFEYFKNATKEGKDYIINLLKHKYEKFDIYEMPKE